MAQNQVLYNVSCWVRQSENLICPSESPWNEDSKIGIGLFCSSNTSQENQQNVFTQFIDVLSTVRMLYPGRFILIESVTLQIGILK